VRVEGVLVPLVGRFDAVLVQRTIHIFYFPIVPTLPIFRGTAHYPILMQSGGSPLLYPIFTIVPLVPVCVLQYFKEIVMNRDSFQVGLDSNFITTGNFIFG
jgi:hypothetical protein